MVGLASNFIVGYEVIPLDAEKHTETPLMEDWKALILHESSMVIAQHYDPYRKIGNIQVL